MNDIDTNHWRSRALVFCFYNALCRNAQLYNAVFTCFFVIVYLLLIIENREIVIGDKIILGHRHVI